MNSKNKEQHAFAFYYPETTKLGEKISPGQIVTLDDPQLIHRIMHVLRLKKDETFVLFDAHKQSECLLEQITERTIQLKITTYDCNEIFGPPITFLLPLLKKEALEESLYALTKLGANTVQLVITKKSQRIWGGQKEQERMQRIVHAAAEQSKNFAFPTIYDPVSLESAITSLDPTAVKIFFDKDGCHLSTVITSINTALATRIVLLVGPEGDLTGDEKAYLNAQGFVFCQLTKTVLRSRQAVAVSLGALRSLLRTYP